MHSGSTETRPACADLAQTHRAQPQGYRISAQWLRGQRLASTASMGRARGFLPLVAEPQVSKERTVPPEAGAPCRQVVPRAAAGPWGKHRPNCTLSRAALGQAAWRGGQWGCCWAPPHSTATVLLAPPGVLGQPAPCGFPWRSGSRAGLGLPLPASPALLPARPLP